MHVSAPLIPRETAGVRPPYGAVYPLRWGVHENASGEGGFVLRAYEGIGPNCCLTSQRFSLPQLP